MSAQAGLVRIKTSHDTVIVACPPMPSFSPVCIRFIVNKYICWSHFNRQRLLNLMREKMLYPGIGEY